MHLISTLRSSRLSSFARMFLIGAVGTLCLANGAHGVGGQTIEDDHGDTIGTATSLTLGSSVEGRIDPGEDLDVFKLDLSGESSETDVWIYATGELDSFGELLTSRGEVIVANDDSNIQGRWTAFHIRWPFAPGVYYIQVSGFSSGTGERPTGEYTLHTEAVTNYPGGTAATAAPLELGTPTPGMVDTASDANYFRLDLAESMDLRIYALTFDLFDENDELLPLERIDAEVLDSEGVEIPVNVHWDFLGFYIVDDLGPGTHYIKITTPDYISTHPVPYTIHAYEDTEYAIFIEDCEAATQALTASQTDDPLYGCQWHLNNREGEDINVEAVWAEDITGRGVNVAVVDDGMDHRHEDLRDNGDVSRNHDYSGAGDLHDPYAHHGTNVAGIIAARDNDTGVRGVAPRATIYGYNFLHPTANTDMEMADSMARHRDVTAVSNNSWGPFDGPGLGAAPRIWELAVDSGIKGGYEGRGVFYAFAAGNGHLAGDEANLDENSNYYGVTAVCAVDDGDTRSAYSETGANLWICAPSNGGTRGILTTENSDRYNPRFGGTSAATPIIAGVAALMREANPDLTWRDLKLILAASARKNDADNPGWEKAARKFRAESDSDRYHFNHEYGFGMVDAKAAVDLAKEWKNLPPLESSTSESSERNLPVPDSPASGDPTTVESTVVVDTNVGFVEFVEVNVSLQHDSIRDLNIELVSPSGAVSQLTTHLDTYDAYGEFFPLRGAFRFGSARHLGEDPNGEWRLRVTDHVPTMEGTLDSWSVTVYGHTSTPRRPVIDWITTDEGSLTVGWVAPQQTGGSPVTGYDLRYIASSSDEAVNSNWTVVEDVWTANGEEKLEYTLTGLEAGSRYDVQVRAVNENGASLWSETFSAAATASVCDAEGTVPDASSNPGLMSDCRVLMEVRDALAPSGALDWAPNTPITTWRGITVKGTPNRVVALSLQEEGLTGTIPAEMKGLVKLTELELSQNGLTDEIPPELGSLVKLTELDLSQNGLTGTIPTELGSLVKLTELDLSQNGLTGTIPAELGSLVKLTELDLSQNGLTGTIPVELGRLARLTFLSLKDNELGGEIPEQLQGLINLRSLFLAGNSFTGCIPAKLHELAEHDLDQLDIRYCDDRILLIELYHATDGANWTNNTHWLSDEPMREWHGVTADSQGRVVELSLSGNQLTGEIPAGLGSLSKLQLLSLWGNELSGEIPKELGNLSNLQELLLFNNQLTGEMPTQLGDLSNLKRLDLGNNQLGGGIPAQLGNLTNLQGLSLLGNELNGEIPTQLGNLANLEWLYLGNNQLSGEIPAELGSLSNLQGLSLLRNELSGEIPAELGSLSNLQELNLGNNQLSGEILAELGSLSILSQLLLGVNRLNGELPAEVGNLANLTWLDLFSNQLTGELPQSFTRLTALETLRFQNNDGLCAPTNEAFHTWLQGVATVSGDNCALMDSAEDRAVLVELYNATNGANWTNNTNWLSDKSMREWHGVTTDGEGRVAELSLGRNRLTGEIPAELGNLSNLRQLSLWGNELSGDIPTVLGNLSNLTRLILFSNQLNGTIPTELGNLSNLTQLQLSSNRLTGEIPAELGRLSKLEILQFNSNQLTGEIPMELGSLANLIWLSLNDNELEGSIPASLGSLSHLESLYLSNNRFTGCVPPRLRDVPDNDFDRLGLPFCPVSPPEAPTIDSVTSAMDSLTISWSPPPGDGGSDITAYDLRYIETDEDETADSNWTVVEDVWTTGGDLEYTLAGLTVDTQYDLQVRAVNDAGDGSWSDTVTGTPTMASACVTGGAVADATNSGLISDCEALLAARDTLAGNGSLNWSADTFITQWNGVSLGGTPRRVIRLNLAGQGLSGMIPPELGRLSMLTHLNLRSNDGLTGEIPDALGNLGNLRVLNLHSNSHTGAVPDLRSATSLEELYLHNNADYNDDGSKVDGSGLTGGIPTWLNGMTNMRELWLWGNSLSGAVPDLSGMTGLDKLKLANNNLTGGVPEASQLPPNMTWLIIDRNPFGGTIPDLSSLSRLRLLWLHSSELTGSVPAGDMLPVSLDDLNLRDNMLMGGIPDLSNLDNLTRLRLHNNRLSGEVPATLGGLDSLKYLWLHNEVDKGLGNNAFTSIAVGVGDLANTLIVIALNGNPWADDACVPAALANVAKNDYTAAGLSVCSAADGS